MPRFEERYKAGTPPWDIGKPQPEIVKLQEAGKITGSVLDAGCGTGENALYLASKGHDVWGVDYEPIPIDSAEAKAKERGIEAVFIVGSALELENLGREFNSVIDSGLFHSFDDDDRAKYVTSLASVLRSGGRFFMLCFSDAETREGGPRRITQQEIYDSFSDGWDVEEIRATTFEANLYEDGHPRAWIVTVRKI